MVANNAKATAGPPGPLLALGGLALILGLWTGLARLGWVIGPVQELPLGAHGPLMVSGFLGTLIGIERAVAMGGGWTWVGPLASGLGAMALVAAPASRLGAWAMLVAAGSMLLVMLRGYRIQPTTATRLMAVAPLGWLVANLLLLLGHAPFRAIPGWGAFLLLTIGGERLILAPATTPHGAAGRRAAVMLWVAVLLCAGGPAAALVVPGAGARVSASGWVLLAAWLLRFDVARRLTHQPGLPRFVAGALLAGYGWLAVSGLLLASQGLDPALRHLWLPGLGTLPGLAVPYDAALHALFVGFVLSLVFGHAPIVVPAILRRPLAWQRRFWVHLLLLHASLALRLIADLAGDVSLRAWAGMGNAVAVLLFVASTAFAVLKSSASRTAPTIG